MFAASKSGRSSAGGGGTTDPYFPYVPLLLETTSTNGQQNNTFLDSSSNTFTITRNGTPTQGSYTPYWPNGQWSNYFNGTTDYLTVASNSGLAFGTNNFTIEFWVYLNTVSGTQIFYSSQTSGSYTVAPDIYLYNGKLYVQVSSANPINGTGPTTLVANRWYHIALVKSSGTTTLYVNGTFEASFSDSNTYVIGANRPVIGVYGYNPTVYYLNGYLSNLRVVNGTAIVPPSGGPTAPLTPVTNTSLLTCQSNRFLDTNTQLTPKVITPSGTPRVQAFQPFSPTASYTTALYGGSGYFNGSTDYLTAPTNAAFDLGANNFTIEAWIQTTSSVQYTTIAARQIASATGNWWFLINNASATAGDVAFWCYDYNSFSTQMIVTTGASVRDGAWHHVALVRNGSAWAIYIDGVSRGTQTSSITIGTLSAAVYVGNSQQNPTKYFPGYISNFRMVNGAAVYTGTPFTPPTLAPLTTAGSTSAASYSSTTNVNTSFAASSTSLLLNMTNAGIYDAAVQNNAITVGDAQASTTQSKWSPTSMKFDGTGDALNIASNPALNFGSGSFTLEAWVYLTTMSGDFFTIGSFGSGGAFFGWRTADIGYGRPGVAWDYQAASGMVVNNWYHIAYSRSGTDMRMFVNGQQKGVTQPTSQAYDLSLTYTTVGALQNANFLNGYIQDLRITKGIGRYTANFSVPSAAFPTR